MRRSPVAFSTTRSASTDPAVTTTMITPTQHDAMIQIIDIAAQLIKAILVVVTKR